MFEIFHSPDSIIWCFPPDFHGFSFVFPATTNHRRLVKSPAIWWTEEQKFVISKSKYGGEKENKKSYTFILDIKSILIFDFHWPASRIPGYVSFMTNGFRIQILYSHFICMILLSQPREAPRWDIEYLQVFLRQSQVFLHKSQVYGWIFPQKLDFFLSLQLGLATIFVIKPKLRKWDQNKSNETKI